MQHLPVYLGHDLFYLTEHRIKLNYPVYTPLGKQFIDSLYVSLREQYILADDETSFFLKKSLFTLKMSDSLIKENKVNRLFD